MFYSLLGRMVWFGLKLFLRNKYGPRYVPKGLVAGGTVAAAVALTVAIQRASRSTEE